MTENVKSRAASFETYVKEFLTKMGFNDINGDQKFRISGKQIDAAFGSSDRTYVVVSCVTGSKGARSLEGKINELKGWEPSLTEGLKEVDSLKKRYDKIKLVLATKGPVLTERDKNQCNSDPKVFVWDQQFFDYYSALYEKIGKYAKYELQRELEIKLDDEELNGLRNIPGIKITDNLGEQYYIASVNPIELLKITYVARRERGDKNFYQRMINDNKLKKIAYSLGKEKLSFYNNIILTSEDSLGIEFNEMESANGITLGKIKFNANLKALWIVDGQHRLYGYAKVKDDKILQEAKIPVTIILNKKEKDQANIFITINTNQTKLPEDYKWDLYTIYDAKEQEKISALAAKRLNELDNLKNKVYIPSLSIKKNRGMIPISKIARTISEQRTIFHGNLNENKPNPIYRKGEENTENNANKLASLIDRSLSRVKSGNEQLYKFFVDSTGIQIFIRLLSDYFLNFGGSENAVGYYIEYLCEYVSKNGIFADDSKIKEKEKTLNSRVEKKLFIDELAIGINKEIQQDPSPKVPLLYVKEADTPVNVIERMLREFVKKSISESDPNWYKQRVPNDIRLNLEKKAKSVEDQWKFVDLGSIIKIIEQTQNWNQIFEKKFINENSLFRDKNQVLIVLNQFKIYRDPISHDRDISGFDKKYGELAAEHLKNFLNLQVINDEESEEEDESN